MRFGIFSNQQRHTLDTAASWQEDIDEVVLADRLGFEEAWISEHAGLGYLQDGLACPDHMIARIAGLTDQIKFGPAVRRLALYNPVQLAVEMVTMDNLLPDRYLWAYGHGGPVTGYEQRGVRFEDTHAMMEESIDLILRCLRETEPFDYEGIFYRGEKISVWPKAWQKPHPPIWLASNTPSKIEAAAKRGFNFFLSQYARPSTMRQLGGVFTEACLRAGRGPSVHSKTAVHAIFVGDTDEQAFNDLAPGFREHLEFNKKYFGAVFNDWIPSGGTLADLTYEHLVDEGLVFVGSPLTVADRLRDFYAESGGFGIVLVIAGKNWGGWEQREKSMHLLMEQVAPALADVGPQFAGDLQFAAATPA
jgi:limonene 1,2-monooxygenase